MALLTLVLIGAGVGAVALVGGGGSSGGTRPKRTAVPDVPSKPWSAAIDRQLVVDAPGWYADVVNDESGYCGGGSVPAGLGPIVCNDGGRWTPVPVAFAMPLVELSGAKVLTVDVTITDEQGVVARTKYRTRKDTSGRKRGNLDVNEYTLEGAARETAYCERLTRKFNGAAAGAYTERVVQDCGVAETPRQPYTLYRAQRETTVNGISRKVSEWFAKIRPGAAYPGTGAYALQLRSVGGVATLTGEVAASLAPQRLTVAATFRVREQ